MRAETVCAENMEILKGITNIYIYIYMFIFIFLFFEEGRKERKKKADFGNVAAQGVSWGEPVPALAQPSVWPWS